jgi:ATP-dependent DNA helicase DinG
LARLRASALLSDVEFDQLQRMKSWLAETSDGSLSSLPFRPQGSLWDEVASDNTNCMGRRCPTHGKCFYYQDRRRMQHAQILVVNHALLFSDIALRRAGVSILPDYDILILDEAHTVESVAGDHLGINVTSGSVEFALNKLYNDRTNKGLLVHHGLAREQQQVDRCRHQADMFFGDLYEWRTQHAPKNGRVSEVGVVANHLSADLEALARQLKTAGSKLREESEQQDFIAAHDRLMSLAGEIEMWRMQAQAGTVYWIESSYNRRGTPRLTLAAAPVDVGPAMREQLFDKVPTVIMTSATLSVVGSGSNKGRGGFELFQSRIGLTLCLAAQVGRPFNFREQAELVTLRDMPDPAQSSQEFEKRCVPLIQEYAGRTDGRTFVLFTSYDMLRRMAAALQPWLVSRNLRLLSQADGTPRTQMLDEFKRDPRAVLLGTDSFW